MGNFNLIHIFEGYKNGIRLVKFSPIGIILVIVDNS